MFLPNKIIKNNEWNYQQKNVGKVLKPGARPSKQSMVLLYIV